MRTRRPTTDTAVDLYAGAGGLTEGLKNAGFRVLAAVESDQVACDTYALNHPEVALLRQDIREVVPHRFLAAAGLQPGELALLVACAPCQGYSTLGRRDPNDPRNDLILKILDFVEVLAPRAIALENVPGLARDRRFRELVDRLNQLGYGVWWGIVDAADYGVPQRRRRLVVIAVHGVRDEAVPPLEPTVLTVDGNARHQTVSEALASLPHLDAGDPLHTTRPYPAQVMARIRAIPKEGGSRKDLPPELRLRCHERLGSNSTAVYGRMRSDEVAPTLTSRCVTPACGRFLHPTEDRAITLREAATLQSFDPSYRFAGGRMAITRQIGNAVPPKLAEAIGRLPLGVRTTALAAD